MLLLTPTRSVSEGTPRSVSEGRPFSPALDVPPSGRVLRWTRPGADRFAIAAAFAILAVSLALRLLWLDRLPGINGDEAWYGVQILRFVHGAPWSGRTPTGLPINPLLFLTEWLLLQCFAPSFWILRLPVAIWSIAGLTLTYFLYRWVYGKSSEAILVVCLTACMPAHLAYSRFCWDGSFAFVSFPLFAFPLLRVLGGHRGPVTVLLLIAGGFLTVWVHATHALLVIAGLAMMVWQFHGLCWSIAQRRPIATTVTLIASVFVTAFSLRRSHVTRSLFDSVSSSIERLPEHLAGLSEVILGPRVFEYLTGLPAPGWIWVADVVFYVTLACLLFSLLRWGDRADGQLAILTIGVVVLVLIAGRTLRLHRASYERYILYLVPLFALVLVRAIGSMSERRRGFVANLICPWIPLGLSSVCLMQFWYNYFDPLHGQTYAAQQHRTFQSGLMEPKAAAAALIRARSKTIVDPLRVYVEDWWIEHALVYLLEGRPVIVGDAQPDAITGPAYVVGFTGSAFITSIIDAATNRHELRELAQIPDNGESSSILTVISLGPSSRPESAVRDTITR